ncbi:MAG: hypothetical protein K2X98_01260, partial [Alphaproteobacteria bacterium]|nr:hypothetical protein [Alphaproteobacteria bacterium]
MILNRFKQTLFICSSVLTLSAVTPENLYAAEKPDNPIESKPTPSKVDAPSKVDSPESMKKETEVSSTAQKIDTFGFNEATFKTLQALGFGSHNAIQQQTDVQSERHLQKMTENLYSGLWFLVCATQRHLYK